VERGEEIAICGSHLSVVEMTRISEKGCSHGTKKGGEKRDRLKQETQRKGGWHQLGEMEAGGTLSVQTPRVAG